MFSLSNRGVAARDPSPFHPARPGTVAQQIRALVSVGLGQRHKSCHVTASRWWPLGGTWPTNRLGDFSEEWMVQKKQWVEKSATYNLWDDNVTNLYDGRMLPPTKWDDDVTKPRWENCHMRPPWVVDVEVRCWGRSKSGKRMIWSVGQPLKKNPFPLLGGSSHLVSGYKWL